MMGAATMVSPADVVWSIKVRGLPSCPEAEAIIATDPHAALEHAMENINGRFLAGEDAIATDPDTAVRYAVEVIKCRFPAGEAAIAESPRHLIDYLLGLVSIAARAPGLGAELDDFMT